MLKRFLCCLCVLALLGGALAGCGKSAKDIKVGVSFGVGAAARWPKEQTYMEERAQELGIQMEVRLNTTDEPKTQLQDCKEMIDSGIDVLVLTPRDVNNAGEILSYAAEKKVPVVNYARVLLGDQVDLLVGYDSGKIGQSMGQYLTEMVYEGDFIILKGDPGDYNAKLLYDGAMRYIDPLRGNINVLLEADVPGWSPDEAKAMVKEAVAANDNKVDAILAPNDKIAGACVEALDELGVTQPVAITGMDAELDAIKRIVNDKQGMTIYMDLRDLARTAVDEAYSIAMGEEMKINAKFDNQSTDGVDAYLINGRVVTKENVDNEMIKTGYYTQEEVYG